MVWRNSGVYFGVDEDIFFLLYWLGDFHIGNQTMLRGNNMHVSLSELWGLETK